VNGPEGIVERTLLAAYAWVEDDDRILLVRLAPTEVARGCEVAPSQ